MGIFSMLFGKSDPKDDLIRVLVKARIESYSSVVRTMLKDKMNIDNIPKHILMGLPESTIVWIVEQYWAMKAQKSMTDQDIFAVIEKHRSRLCGKGDMPANLNLTTYVTYRVNLEHEDGLPIYPDHIDRVIREANKLFMKAGCNSVKAPANEKDKGLTAEQIGAALYLLVTGMKDSDRESVKKCNIELTDKVLTEIFILKVATVGIYIRMNFDDDDEVVDDAPTCDFLSSAFFNYIEKKLGKETYFNIYCLQSAYVAAYGEPHSNGPAWQIGKVFAKKSCGIEMSTAYILLGSTLFSSMWTGVDFLLTEITKNFRRI